MINNKITQITIGGSGSSSVQFIASDGTRTALSNSGILTAGENKLLISCQDMSFNDINRFSIINDIGVTIRADKINSETNTAVMIYAVDGNINTVSYDVTDRIFLGESSLSVSNDGTYKIIYFKMNRLFMNGYEWSDKTLVIEPVDETSLTIFNEINVEASYVDESNNSEKTAKLKGSIGFCGQYEMNLATSNMRVHTPLFNLSGKGYPLSCNLHYNEASIDSDYLEVINEQSKIYSVNTGLPSGMKLDCMQFLKVNLDSVDYVDSYGIKHIFAEANNYANSEKVYYDTKGTGSYLEYATDRYIMTTQFDDKLEFTNSGVSGIFVLTKITNKYGKCLNFVYNSTTRYYTSSNDELGRTAEFQYSNGFLSKIIVKENDDVAAEKLEYTFNWNAENRTFSITHPNNITAIYTYNEDNYLISMKEGTNSADMARAQFERNNVLKINKISEYYGNQLIQEYTVSSGYPKAQVKNNKNIITHYRFLENGEISESYEEGNCEEENIICKCDDKTIRFPTSETTLWEYDNNYAPFSQRLLYTYTKPQGNLPAIFSEKYRGKKAIFAVDANSNQYSGDIDFGITFYNAGEYIWGYCIRFEQYEDGKIRKCSFVTIPDSFDRIDVEANYRGQLGEVSVGKLSIHEMTTSFYEDYSDFYGGTPITEDVSDNSAPNYWYKLGNNTPVCFKTYDETINGYTTTHLRQDFHYEDLMKTICDYRKLPLNATSMHLWYNKLKSMVVIPMNDNDANLDVKFGIGDNQKHISEIKCAQIIQQDGYELNDDNDLVSVNTKIFSYSTYSGRDNSFKRTHNNVTVVTKNTSDVEAVSIFKETSIYDSKNNLIETCDKNGIITKYTLNDDGEIIEVRRYISGNADNTGLRQTSVISDIESSNENVPDLCRTASSSYADGKITTNTQDVELFEGKPYALTAPNGKKTQFEYYSDKTLKKIGVILEEDENSNSFTYDDRMRVNSVTHGGSVFNFEYDNYNKLKSIYCAENKLLDKNNVVTTTDDTTTLTYAETDKLMYTYDKYGREVMMSVWESDDNGGRYVDKLINIYCDDNSAVQQLGTDSTQQNSGMRGSVFDEEESDLSPILSLNAKTYDAEFLSISNLSKLRRTVDNYEECMYNYMYNNLDQLVKVVKCTFNGVILNVTTFIYDGLKRLVCRKVSDVGDITYTYFDDSLDSKVSNSVVPLTIERYSSVTSDDIEFKLKGNVESDLYGRVTTIDNVLQSPTTHLHKYKDVYEYCYGWSEKHVLPEGMSYIDGNGNTQISTGLPIFLKNGTSNKVSKINRYSAGSMVDYENEPQSTVEFTYNSSGNITQIVEEDKGNSLTYKTGYQYDGLNRLTRENNQKLDKTYTYTYDTNGNILTKNVYGYTTGTIVAGNSDESLNTPVEKSYTYSYDSVWKDRLIAFDGVNIDYNSGYAGNPSNYRGKNTSWTRGSLLSTYGNITFEYNAFGQRIKKTVGDERVHTYEYDGSNLVRENVVYTNPQEDEEDYTLEYVYNHLGLAMMIYSREGSNTEIYHYMKNSFGDVTDMYSASQNFKGVYGTYAYNGYGEFEILTNNRNAATLNPFRYRGHYYDEDLKLYWVGTRLYDPETGRFVCADDVSNLNMYVIGGMNLFASKFSANITQNSVAPASQVYTYTKSIDVVQSIDKNSQLFTSANKGFDHADTLWGLSSTLIDSRYRINYASRIPYHSLAKQSYRYNYSYAMSALDDLKWLKRTGYVFTALDGFLTTASYIEQGYSVEDAILEGAYEVTKGVLSSIVGGKIGAAWGAVLSVVLPFPLGFIAGVLIGMVASYAFEELVDGTRNILESAVD